jgi:hypothetical protein
VNGSAFVERVSSNPNLLQLHGYELDTIQRLSGIMTPTTLKDPVALSTCITMILSSITNGNFAERSLARTLIADTSFQTTKSTSEDLRGFSKMMEHLSAGRQVPTLEEIDDHADEEIQQLACYRRAFEEACRQRKIAITKCGRLALCPKLSAPGDLVVAVFQDSGGFPYVLRPCDNGYKLIGACYVDGEMPGQDGSISREHTMIKKSVFAIY